MKFAIFGNTFQAHKSIYAETLFHLLKQHGSAFYIDYPFYRFLKEENRLHTEPDGTFDGDGFEADMVLSLGGDGTFLRAANRAGSKNIPILGINTGRLGFLADISPKELEQAIAELHARQFQTEERSILQLSYDNGCPKGSPFALNEIAVLKRDSSSMIAIHTEINGEYLTTYQADGLIVATPTGSTAYSLSVGGPIMFPDSPTLTLTPVAPHSLNVRPIVLSDNCEIRLRIESRSHIFLVAVDGRSEACKETTELTIRKAPYTIKIVKRCNHRFFDTLRNKLMWGIDSRVISE